MSLARLFHPLRRYRVQTCESSFTGYVEALDSGSPAVVVSGHAALRLDPGHIDAAGRLQVSRQDLPTVHHGLRAVVLGPCEITPVDEVSADRDELALVVVRQLGETGWWSRLTESHKILTADDEVL